MNGDLKLNPFRFHHFNVSEIKISVDNELNQYSVINMNFAENEKLLGLYSLFTGLDTDGTNNIDRATWGDGNVLFAFDLKPSKAVKAGSVKIELVFSEGLSY